MKRLALAVLCVVAMIPTSGAAGVERAALVIGNGAYRHAPVLKNPGRDSEAVAGLFRTLGFDWVEHHRDLDKRAMEERLMRFAQKADNAKQLAIYYAGHGLEANGRNYLLPVDARLQNALSLRFEAIDLDLLLAAASVTSGLRLIILDACRDNPLANSMRRDSATRSVGRGLARLDPASGSLIAYAAKAGQQALDGTVGGHSPYAAALLRHLVEPGIDIRILFGKVRDSVLATTGHRQEPFTYGSLPGREIFLRPPLPTTPVSPVPATPTAFDVDRLQMDRFVAKRSNLRAGPGTGYARIGRLETGHRVLVTGKVRGQAWYRIAHDKGQAFIWAPLLTETKPAPPPAVSAAPRSPRLSSRRNWSDPVTGMRFVHVPGGTFTMGCQSWNRACWEDEKPAHRVVLDGFWLGKYEVTLGEWRRVMGTAPSHFKRGERHPVENISWNDAQAFIARLNRMGRARFALPTEAQWEYACRSGGNKELFSGGNRAKTVAWHGEPWERGHQPVGRKRANGLGLHDMSGNVREWVQDADHAYPHVAPGEKLYNPVYESDTLRITRGGDWDNASRYARCTARGWNPPEFKSPDQGLRLVRLD